MIVVDVQPGLLRRVAADPTDAALVGEHRFVLLGRDAVDAPQPEVASAIRIRYGCTVACVKTYVTTTPNANNSIAPISSFLLHTIHRPEYGKQIVGECERERPHEVLALVVHVGQNLEGLLAHLHEIGLRQSVA